MATSALKVFAGAFQGLTAPTLTSTTAGTIAALAGRWFFADANGTPLTAAPATKQAFKIGQILGEIGPITDTSGVATYVADVKWSTVIEPTWVKNADKIKAYTATAWTTSNPAGVGYAAPAAQTTVIDLDTVVVDSDKRYVLRIQYKDLEQLGAQPAIFTRSYEVVNPADAAALVNGFANAVNAEKTKRVTAVANTTDNTVTLTAVAAPYNDIDKFSYVMFDASVYATDIEAAILYNNYYESTGATITTTAGTAGKGYYWQVRDLEKLSNAYQGDVYQIDWIKRNDGYLNATVGKTYAQYSIDFAGQHQTADSQYTKPFLANVILFDSATPAGSSVIITTLKTLLGV